jgi:probable rRNA maturation factor
VGIERSEIHRRLVEMIKLLQLEKNEISFVLTDDKRVHQLNKIYRNIDRSTDVLAFAMQEGEFRELAGTALGDVIVSVPTAKKQALERGVPLLDEVTMLLAHGLLHLLGWDHDTPAKDRRMRAETDRLCVAAAPVRPLRRLSTGLSTSRTQRSKAGGSQSDAKDQSLHRVMGESALVCRGFARSTTDAARKKSRFGREISLAGMDPRVLAIRACCGSNVSTIGSGAVHRRVLSPHSFHCAAC